RSRGRCPTCSATAGTTPHARGSAACRASRQREWPRSHEHLVEAEPQELVEVRRRIGGERDARAALDHAALVEDRDLVAAIERRKPVRDDDRSAAVEGRVEGGLA